MARTKKQQQEKLSEKINLHKQLLKSSSEAKDWGDTSTEHSTSRTADEQDREEPGPPLTSAADRRSMTVDPSQLSAGAGCVFESRVLVRRAVVLVPDISQSPDELLATMVKKQLTRVSPGAKSPARAASSPEDKADATGREGKRLSGADTGGTGDGMVSSSTSVSSKNIFEQFSMGRKSPRNRSPRSKQASSTVHSDSSGARSGSEEKQQQSIVTAVRALRGLSGKVGEGHPNSLHTKKHREGDGGVSGGGGGHSRKNSPRNSECDVSPGRRNSGVGSRNPSPGHRASSRNSSPGSSREIGVRSRNASPGRQIGVPSRNASPGSTPSRGHNSTSPKRHSPRRAPEKISPPVQKSPKTKQFPSSASGSDCGLSPVQGRRGRSPHRASEGELPLNSPRSSHSSQGQGKPPARNSGQKSRAGGDGFPSKVTKPSPQSSPGEHTIHILSSTGRGSKVVQVKARPSPASTSRRLFVDKDNNNLDENKQRSPSKCEKGLRSKQTCDTLEVSVTSASSSAGSDQKQAADDAESLLCAMLVGGSEVTKSYEQSRDKSATQVGKPQSSAMSDRLNESFGSMMNSRDSFFDDDFAGDFAELKPYELPVLSQLPPLGQPDLAVLDLTKTEKCPSEELPSVQCPPGHVSKTVSILSLISRVKDNLPSDSEIVADAERILQEQNSETEEKICEPTADVEREKEVDTESHVHSQPQVKESDATASVSHDKSCEVDIAEKASVSVSCEGVAQALQPEKQTGVSVVPCISTSGDSCVAGECSAAAECSMAAKCSASDPARDEAVDRAGTPSSLGELDTAKITQAANLAVQDPMSSGAKQEIVKMEIVEDTPGSQQNTGEKESTVKLTSSQGPVKTERNSPLPGTSMAAASTSFSKPGSSRSTFRSFFSRISSPSKTRWKPKTELPPTTGPGWSKWHSIRSPLPIDVLGRHENDSRTQKGSAFASRDLEQYLRRSANRMVIPACSDSKLAKFLLAEGYMKDYNDLQRQASMGDVQDRTFDEDEVEMKSEEEEEVEEDERDSEVARKLDPDFDEVEGLVFVSFPSEMAVSAHLNLEKSLQWEADPAAYVNMAKFHAFEESRRKDGKIRRQSQNLRGQHMKWRKYQRLYRKELRKLYVDNNKDIPLLLARLPEKTTDVQKIKNWKKKLSDLKTEDLEAMELLGEEEEEERVKRKRKTYVFSSKKKKSKRLEGRPETPKIKEEAVEERREEEEEEDELNTSGEWEQEEEEEIDEEGYGAPIPLEQDDYMEDVHNSLEEMRRKEKGLKKSKGIFARFNMGPEDRHIFKKLGGWVTRFRRYRRKPPPPEIKEEEGEGHMKAPKKKRGPRKERFRPSFELRCMSMGHVVLALRTLEGESVVDTWNMEAGIGGSHGNNTSAGGEGGEVVDLTAEDTTPEVKAEKPHCDKPGCRYGCICHLCLPSAESDETEPPVTSTPAPHACDKEYCRLGCICDSLEKSGSKESGDKPDVEMVPTPLTPKPASQPEARKEGVRPAAKDKGGKETKEMHQLTIVQQDPPPAPPPHKSSTGDHAESSGDELPTLEKTAPRRQRSVDRYSNLPRRQTSYRMAKNLDAVSRKAMMMWEMSEVYSEQTSNRRKKTPESSATMTHSPSPSAAVTSPAILSSSSASSSSHTQQTNTVTTAVSVNTLPALMMTSSITPRTLTMPPPAAGRHNTSGATQETSLVVSDEETHHDTAGDAKFQSKRSRMKKRLFSKESEQEMQAKKMKTSTELSAPTNTTSPAPVSTTASGAPPTSSPTSAGVGGKTDLTPIRSQSQWHSSLICLKASNTGSTAHHNDSDDVMEEDEIKLFEFIVNCSWERCKSKILAAITNTLKRGVYPEPRVMHIGDFRVEILPKAARPSIIPKELRSKLPKTMFSVRVKITEAPKSPAPINVAQNSLLFPATPIPAFYSGVSSIQGVLPVSGLMPAACTSPAPVLTSLAVVASSAAVSCSPSTGVTSGNVGISGLGHLQISHNKVTTASVTSGTPTQSMQHFKIQKDTLGTTQGLAVEGNGEKKKKKKKKKKKNVDPGDDSLVPDLSNLTVSPRQSSVSSPTSAGLPTIATATTTTFRTPGPITSTLRPPLVSTVTTSSGANKVPTSTAQGGAAQVRPQLLGLPNLPANLSGVKFLQLPGQNNLLQIVPASALGLKPMDNKNVPNFVAVPVSLTSMSPAGLAATKKPGSRVQIDIPSKLFAQAQNSLPRPSGDPTGGKVTVNVGDGKSDGEAVTAKGSGAKNGVGADGKPVKKKRKKRSKKEPAAGAGDGDPPGTTITTSASSVVSSTASPILVASSPSPVMTLANPYPVQMVKNTHSSAFTAGESPPHSSLVSTMPPLPAKPTGGSFEDITMTTGETTVMLAKSAVTATDSCSGLKGCEESGSTTLSAHASGVASDKSGVGSAAVPRAGESAPFVQAFVESLQDSVKPCREDDDSRGSSMDILYLSSDSEEDLDVGTYSPPPADVTEADDETEKKQKTKCRNMAIHRDNEQKRRANLGVGYRELTKVLNVSNNLPKFLSQQTTLAKPLKTLHETVKLIQYHQKVCPRLEGILGNLRTNHQTLKRRLDVLIGEKMKQGMTKNTIQTLLQQATPPANQDTPPTNPCSPVLFNEEAHLSHSPDAVRTVLPSGAHSKSSGRKRRESAAEMQVGGGGKSRFIIEIDRGDEDEVSYTCENSAEIPSSQQEAGLSVCETPVENSHGDNTSGYSDSGMMDSAAVDGAEMEICTASEAPSLFGVTQPMNSAAVGSNPDPLISSVNTLDEVDGAVFAPTGENNRVNVLHESEGLNSAGNKVIHTGEERVSEHLTEVSENLTEGHDILTELRESLTKGSEHFTEVGENLPEMNENRTEMSENLPELGINLTEGGEHLTKVGENLPEVGEHLPEVGEHLSPADNDGGMGFVITSVTSLHGSGVSFDDDGADVDNTGTNFDDDATNVVYSKTDDKTEEGSSSLS